MRTYQELIQIDSFLGRYAYLRLGGRVGEATFGFDRWLNQKFYHSDEWKSVRQAVILRDKACDLAWPEYELHDRVYIHHMNPITKDDIIRRSELVLNPDYLICVSFDTHQAIHYGDESLLPQPLVIRCANDTCPWR